MKLTDGVSKDEIRRIMREYGPQLSEMYLHPKTQAERECNAREYIRGIRRVRRVLRNRNSEVKPDANNKRG